MCPQHVGSASQHVASFLLWHHSVHIQVAWWKSKSLHSVFLFFVQRPKPRPPHTHTHPFLAVYFPLVFGGADSNWCTVVFIKLFWLLVGVKKRRLETSPAPLGGLGHKCLQGCLCWSLFCSTVGKEGRDLVDPQTLWNAVFVIDPQTNSVPPQRSRLLLICSGGRRFLFFFSPSSSCLKLMVFVFYAGWGGKKSVKLVDLSWCIHCSTGFRDEDVCLYSELFARFLFSPPSKGRTVIVDCTLTKLALQPSLNQLPFLLSSLSLSI